VDLYGLVFPYAFGAALGASVSWFLERLTPREGFFLMAITLFWVILAFPPFPLSAGDWPGLGQESAAAAALLVLLAIGWRRRSARLVALGYLLHGALDLAHLLGWYGADNPRWVHELCVPYDWLVAAILLRKTRSWRGALE
jgi:hypothetical protein